MEALPDGWYGTADGGVTRDVPDGEIVAWRHGRGGRSRVSPPDGSPSQLLRAESLPKACAAAERAYCGCYVGKSYPCPEKQE